MKANNKVYCLKNTTEQIIRFLNTRDHIRLAWAVSGNGPIAVKAANWVTHLEYDFKSPVWRHWMRFFSQHFQFIRYDARGNGLSQRDVGNLSTDSWLTDLESVVGTAQPDAPFTLLGLSQGSCGALQYAHAHPEKVSHLVIYGGYAKGWSRRDDPDDKRKIKAIKELTELGWGRHEEIYRRLFTDRFLPSGSEDQLRWFDELLVKTTSPSMAARLIDSWGDVDIRSILAEIRVPTLIIHARNDQVVPISEGIEIASKIPGAEFVQLESCNHILLEDEPAWDRFQEAVLRFTEASSVPGDSVFSSLTERETDILAAICSGLTNAEIGKQLFISDKTVRNRITRIYEKLGVRTRAQAIVLTREHRVNF